MKPDLVKGFKDFSGSEAEKRAEIRRILIDVFEKYGFEVAETPVIEREEFVRGENSGDEAVSDVFKLQDKGKRKLALRYEFTFQLKRLMKNKKLPYKRYQIGEVFRDEPVTSNRFRQFTQCDVDIVGASLKDEAEILKIVKNIFDDLGIKFEIKVGNRKILNEILEEVGVKKNREQVLRELDKMDKLSEREVRGNLKKLGAEKVLGILKKPENFFKKYEGYGDVEELKKFCKFYGVKIVFQPTLVRGLSYYNGNVFEIKTAGMKETIAAGGSYQIENQQATGISFGLDRIAGLAKIDLNKEKFLVVSLEQDREAIKLAEKLRGQNKIVSIYYGKPSKALEFANSKGISKVIFVGEKEVGSGKFKVKDMSSGAEKFI